MRRHAKHCWGNLIVNDAQARKDDLDIDIIRRNVKAGKIMKDGTITVSFERKVKGKQMYST